MVTVGVISPAVLAAYAATVFVLMITPGPDMLFTLGAGSTYLGLAAKIVATR